jgi:hypothetical protein
MLLTTYHKSTHNKANQHGSLKALRQKKRNAFNAQLFATLDYRKRLYEVN